MSGQALPAERAKVQLLARRSELRQRRAQINQDGLCSRCGEGIAMARLAAIPQAVTCGRCSR